jgi:hypothetical protein
MRRHAECDDILFFAISLEIDRVVTLVPIEDQKAITTS